MSGWLRSSRRSERGKTLGDKERRCHTCHHLYEKHLETDWSKRQREYRKENYPGSPGKDVPEDQHYHWLDWTERECSQEDGCRCGNYTDRREFKLGDYVRVTSPDWKVHRVWRRGEGYVQIRGHGEVVGVRWGHPCKEYLRFIQSDPRKPEDDWYIPYYHKHRDRIDETTGPGWQVDDFDRWGPTTRSFWGLEDSVPLSANKSGLRSWVCCSPGRRTFAAENNEQFILVRLKEWTKGRYGGPLSSTSSRFHTTDGYHDYWAPSQIHDFAPQGVFCDMRCMESLSDTCSCICRGKNHKKAHVLASGRR